MTNGNDRLDRVERILAEVAESQKELSASQRNRQIPKNRWTPIFSVSPRGWIIRLHASNTTMRLSNAPS